MRRQESRKGAPFSVNVVPLAAHSVDVWAAKRLQAASVLAQSSGAAQLFGSAMRVTFMVSTFTHCLFSFLGEGNKFGCACMGVLKGNVEFHINSI